MALSKKDKILHGALRAFSQYGYKNTTMDIIADMADVAKRTLYNHYKTKEDIFVSVNRKGIAMLIDSITRAMNDTNRSLSERLLDVLHEHLLFFSQQQELCKLLINFSSGDEERDEIVHALLGEYFSTMERFLSDLQNQGYINQQVEVSTLASALFGMVGMTVARNLFHGEPVCNEQTKAVLIALCKEAVLIGDEERLGETQP